MSANPKLDIVKEWITLARADLGNAESTFRLELDPTYTTICFHAQQCIEKMMKAVLVYHDIDFPKTHDLAELMDLLRPRLNLSRALPRPDDFTPYAVRTRYPGGWSEITREQVEAALDAAFKIQRRVDNYFKKKKVKI
jgi:HEPN domain-containing protein